MGADPDASTESVTGAPSVTVMETGWRVMATGVARTVSRAPRLVTPSGLAGLVTRNEYVPACSGRTGSSRSVAFVAPSTETPLVSHWYVSGPDPIMSAEKVVG